MNPTCDSNISWDLVIHVCRCGYGSWRVDKKDGGGKQRRTNSTVFSFHAVNQHAVNSLVEWQTLNFTKFVFFSLFLLSENSVRGETLSNQLVATPGERGHDFQLGIIFLLTGNRKQHNNKKKSDLPHVWRRVDTPLRHRLNKKETKNCFHQELFFLKRERISTRCSIGCLKAANSVFSR